MASLKAKSIKNNISNIGNNFSNSLMSEIKNQRNDNVLVNKLVKAPEDIHWFEPLSEEKFLELKLSIEKNGLLNPVIVWEQLDGTYIILAGHNRVRAYKDLQESTKDIIYNTIPAIIFPYESLKDNPEKIKAIIIETNIINRNQFTIKERINTVMYRMYMYKNYKDGQGRGIEELAQEMGLKKSAIYDDCKIGNKLIPEMLEYYYRNKINRKTALQLTRLEPEVQKYLIDFHSDKITTKCLYNMPEDVATEEDIKEYLENSEVPKTIKRIEVQIPEEYIEEYNQMVREWLEKKGIR